jgi:hypothetical protein
MYIFKSPDLIDIFHFCVAHNTKNLTLKNVHASMLVGYTIDYVWIFFSYYFETQKYDYLKKNRITGVQEPKALSIHDMVNPIKLCEK